MGCGPLLHQPCIAHRCYRRWSRCGAILHGRRRPSKRRCRSCRWEGLGVCAGSGACWRRAGASSRVSTGCAAVWACQHAAIHRCLGGPADTRVPTLRPACSALGSTRVPPRLQSCTPCWHPALSPPLPCWPTMAAVAAAAVPAAAWRAAGLPAGSAGRAAAAWLSPCGMAPPLERPPLRCAALSLPKAA